MGKNKYIETPEKMYELFNEYKEKVKSSPRYIYQLSQKIGEAVAIPLEVPLTMEGFNVFCHEKVGCVHQYFANQNNLYDDYMSICSRIREEIRADQIAGGMVGQYNASITQRLNGLVEKQEIKEVKEQPLFPDE